MLDYFAQVALVVNNLPTNAGGIWSGRSSGGGCGNPLPFLPGESRGQRSLVGSSTQGGRETEAPEATWHSTHAQTPVHFTLTSEERIFFFNTLLQ